MRLGIYLEFQHDGGEDNLKSLEAMKELVEKKLLSKADQEKLLKVEVIREIVDE
jgi:hypothetical protein